MSYYELHEIPWKLKEAIKFEAKPSGIQFQLDQGPYRLPKMASPTVITRAGGARIETVNENFELEGKSYFGVAIPIDGEWSDRDPIVQKEWERVRQLADDTASVIGLCLSQRTGLKKVAEYVLEKKADGTPGRMEFRWHAYSGARASISKRSSSAIQRVLSSLLNNKVTPQSLLALRWYEQSKNATNGADRFLSLWIALEALIGPVKDNTALIRKTAQYLTRNEFRLDDDAQKLSWALGLEQMRQVRNRVIHEGARLTPRPVSDNANERDWPQILDDIVGEVLRYRFKSTLTRTLNKHFEEGLKSLLEAPEAGDILHLGR